RADREVGSGSPRLLAPQSRRTNNSSPYCYCSMPGKSAKTIPICGAATAGGNCRFWRIRADPKGLCIVPCKRCGATRVSLQLSMAEKADTSVKFAGRSRELGPGDMLTGDHKKVTPAPARPSAWE